MRGADMGPASHVAALPAFWVGLLYDTQALDEAWQLARDWSAAERETLRAEVPRFGLKATAGSRDLLPVARDALAIAHGGLRRRARTNERGEDETIYLAPLQQIADSGRALAQVRLDQFAGAWKGSVEPLLKEARLV
jgi:glutamate--cysteine ligase